jgi:hypothetical protein
MIVWGGEDYCDYDFGCFPTDTGGVYSPDSDSWTLTSMQNAPSARTNHTAVWTGSQMIVWGGGNTDAPTTVKTGGSYDPIADAWTATDTSTAPSAREDPTAVWTGSLMIVWGGVLETPLNTGGRYDPTSDSWTPTCCVLPIFGPPRQWLADLRLAAGSEALTRR